MDGTDRAHVRPYPRVMARRPRDESPGYHHVVTRGNNKRRIYDDDTDRRFFALHVTRIASKHGWRILAFCLMDNHYHLVIHVGDGGLSQGMCELNTGYAVHYNKVHGRINHLFGKRYWNRRMKSERSLMSVIRYVIQNPKRAGGRRELEAYVWTSYPGTIGRVSPPIALAREELLALFGRTPATALAAFRAFCATTTRGGEPRWQPP
jgi:putative transposase